MKLQTIKAKAQKGFTLIELMITVAIVGILAAVALPAYQDYTIRAQVTEGIALASGAKAFVAEYHSNKGDFPNAASVAEYPGATGKYVSSVAITAETGAITAEFGGDANTNLAGSTVILTPTEESNGNLSWSCAGGGGIDAKYLPSSCKGAATTTP